MAEDYKDILKAWRKNTVNPFLYDHLDVIIPELRFVKKSQGTSGRERWASPLKLDGTLPKNRTREKTLMYAGDYYLREQGDFDNGITVIDYLMKKKGMEFMEVLRDLDRRFNLGMPDPDSEIIAEQIIHDELCEKVLGELKSYFKWCLKNTRSQKAGAVRGYLKNARKFTEAQIEEFGFGFVPSWDNVEKHITQDRKLPKDILDEVCGVRNEFGRTSVGNHHTLAIPYVCGEELKGFLFRTVEKGVEPKYLACKNLDRKSVFFNIPEKVEAILVVEGEMDALTSTRAGVTGVVAMGGSYIAGDRRQQVSDAFHRGVNTIILCPDLDAVVDENGQEKPNYKKRYQAVQKSIHTIKDVNMDFENIAVVEFPYPADPDEIVKKEGAEAFILLVENALPYWKYIEKNHGLLK